VPVCALRFMLKRWATGAPVIQVAIRNEGDVAMAKTGVRIAGEHPACFELCADRVLADALARSLGLDRYRQVNLLYGKSSDLVKDGTFKKAFNGFYKVRKDAEWRAHYYRIFEDLRRGRREPSFEGVLRELFEKTGTVEASFTSKMLATVDHGLPIIDRYVLENTGLGRVEARGEKGVAEAVAKYEDLKSFVQDYLKSPEGRANIAAFDKALPAYAAEISSVKKLDCLLWAKRPA